MALPANGSPLRSIARLAGTALVATAPFTTVEAQATATTATGVRNLIWSVELGVVGATNFVEDGNGVTTRSGLGPFLGAGVTLPVSDRMSFVAGVRGSTAALRVEADRDEWRAGRTFQYDLRIGIETGAGRLLAIAASAFVSRVTGPDDVIPFRSAGGRISIWGGEVAAYRPLVRDPNIDLLIAADAARLGAQPRENPPVAAGWVGRLRLGVRHVLP